jgi:hypothetical protein
VTRRALGRGRLLVSLGALVTLAGTVPPWWTVGGAVTPVFSGNALQGAGVLVFLSAITLLMLVVLPFTRRDGETRLDRPAAFALLAAIGVAGYGLRLVEIASMEALGLPDRAPGLWLTGAGLLVIGWGVVEIFNERRTEW